MKKHHRINHADSTREFHGYFAPKGAFYGYTADGVPFISAGKLDKNGNIAVSLRIKGKWIEKHLHDDLASAIRAEREKIDNFIIKQARCQYTSMSEVKNPSGYVHFT